MSIRLNGIRVTLLALWTTAFFVTASSGADPKVIKTSHESGVKALPQDSEDTIDDLNGDDSYSPQWPEPPNTGAMLLRLFGGTVVVLGLCVASLWFGKPWLQKLQVASTANSPLQIEGSVAIGNRAMLYLVKVGGTQLIAGTDLTGLKSLIALPPTFKEVLDEQVPDAESAVQPAPISFGLRTVKISDSKD